MSFYLLVIPHRSEETEPAFDGCTPIRTGTSIRPFRFKDSPLSIAIMLLPIELTIASFGSGSPMNIGLGLFRLGLALAFISGGFYVYGAWVNGPSNWLLIEDFSDWILYGGVKGNFVLVFLVLTGLGIIFKVTRWVMLGFRSLESSDGSIVLPNWEGGRLIT